jgi:hypothetical protein
MVAGGAGGRGVAVGGRGVSVGGATVVGAWAVGVSLVGLALGSAVSAVEETVAVIVRVGETTTVGTSDVSRDTEVNVGRRVDTDVTVSLGPDTRRKARTAPTKSKANSTPPPRTVTRIMVPRLLFRPRRCRGLGDGLLSLVIDSAPKRGS